MESPIYQNVINMITNNQNMNNMNNISDNDIIKYIMKYLNPNIYHSNIWLTPQNICNIIKKSLWVKKELICISLIKQYQDYIPMNEFNNLIYTELIDICKTTKNKDMLIWLRNLTSNNETFAIIDNIIDNM
jgi:hypothetical protein